MLINGSDAYFFSQNQLGTLWKKIDTEVNSAIYRDELAVKISIPKKLSLSEEYRLKDILTKNLHYTVHIEQSEVTDIYITWNAFLFDDWWEDVKKRYKDDTKDN